MESNQSVSTEGTTTELPNKERLKADASEVVDKAKNMGREQIESGKQTAASQTQKVADVIEQAASQLKESNLRTLADYTSEIGASIKNFSDSLHNRSVDDLVTDIRDMARRNPTAFIMGTVVMGIGISRFFKASAERHQQGYNEPRSDSRVPESDRGYIRAKTEEWK